MFAGELVERLGGDTAIPEIPGEYGISVISSELPGGFIAGTTSLVLTRHLLFRLFGNLFVLLTPCFR
ncbi:hypothetical protein VN97_g6174 [Penicillium thymicola]|uniref:Uncharacterized protein n=1 Tax=Penicillium thymicola TaxID=293382 RepID=A0AAI9X7R0_PENTH|nr:hypothetical protein VN97_g6174 [Penicillium thymicola]